MNCQEFEGDWKMTSVWPDDGGRYEHELKIGVKGNCKIAGKWIDITSGGTVTAIEGQITGGDNIQFVRSGSGLDHPQSYIGRWAPKFAGGTFENYGVWYMERK